MMKKIAPNFHALGRHALRAGLAATLHGLVFAAAAYGSSMGPGVEGPFRVMLPHVDPAPKPGEKVRTQEGFDSVIAELAARHLQRELVLDTAQKADDSSLLQSGGIDAVVARNAPITAAGDAATEVDAEVTWIPTGYSQSPMAIMRTDTTIKSWSDLKGRKVCLSEGSPYQGQLAAQYGALEIVKRAPADSLLATRVGECDASVHDKALLTELLKFPEWKKFSATLKSADSHMLYIAVRRNSTEQDRLSALVDEWKSDKKLHQLNKSRARDIAFEVYLDQTVPDCH